MADRKQVAKYQDLKDDGSTACGGWMYCGIYPKDGHNVARSRTPDGPGGPGSHLGWAFAWPSNRRTLYNRASADPAGKPWSERKKMVWWDEASRNGPAPTCPTSWPPRARITARTGARIRPAWTRWAATARSSWRRTASCQLFVPTGLKDGPLPTHYEPVESPVRNPMYGTQFNPRRHDLEPARQRGARAAGSALPLRVHHLSPDRTALRRHHGRVTPHTAELQPEAFVEISPELAGELGIEHLGWTVLSTLRGEIEVRAMVTERVRPFVIDGRTVHQVAMPWVFGWDGIATGDVANALLAIYGDANTSIHTTKALTCALRAGRRSERTHGVG